MTGALVLLLLSADAADLEDERQEVQQRLDSEKAAFDALGTEKQSILDVLDTMQKLARDSAQRAQSLERAAQRLDQQLGEAKQNQAVVHDAMVEQQRRLAPRLLALYRLQRRDSLGFLLSAGDFATLIKRQRAMKTLVASDAAALDELIALAEYQAAAERRFERLQSSAKRYLRALKVEQAVSQSRLARFQELLTSVQAEQNRMSRVISELEASEKELASMVSELASTTTASGFRARKGHLPFPAKGLVEVGFGKVVNPRFNTVTVQKGIDVRAAAGTPVMSVGTGTVAFSGWLKGYGNLVIVDHGSNYHSLYAHLAESLVEVGNEVEEGEQLGSVGDTGSLKGAYLYFEIRKQGQAVDPQNWLAPQGD